MARINPELLRRLSNKLGVSDKRVYALILKKVANEKLPRHLAAIALAGDHGISIQKYASAEEIAELRGAHQRQPPAAAVAAADPPRRPAARRGGRASRQPKTKENTVFVVHGRDAKLRDSMYAFLGALGLEVQEWGHAIRAASRGKGGNPYVNDAVQKIMESAQAIVVMLSPDDEAKLKDQFVTSHERGTEGKPHGQARPNVIFETGIAIGTHHRKTVIVQVGDVKSFTDIGGMHILHFDGSDHARNDLAKRLEGLGCDVDTAGDHWLRAGDFAPTAARRPKKKRKKGKK